jgi:2-C-methyl-D-erythritol 4-phosphate cytidylyltransferase
MSRYFALIPAAGSGSRVSGPLPKQYLPLAGRPLLYYAVRRLCAHPEIREVYLVLAPGDRTFARSDWSEFGPRLKPLHCGGETRAASVLNALLAMREAVAPEDWIVVHDAARPCLSRMALDKLMRELRDDDTGGLLAVPVADTLKRSDREERVAATPSREHLWQAQTPQMFRYRVLFEAMRAADPQTVTDESSAVEAMGLKPRLVMGEPRNLKVTYVEDLALAQLILESDEAGAGLHTQLKGADATS